MKKLLSIVLAFALVLTSMSMAFASTIAPAEGIEDDDVRAAVERLSAMGILAGKPDGKFHEEDYLTREEFAKILALAVNLGKAADAAKGTTRFTDVPATNWASGYVNVAAGRNLILGRGDGTFGLGVQVTAEEAITMLIRALGYRDEWLEGTWPANMVTLADEIGLLDDVDFVPGFATRGLAAQLTNAALELPTVKKELLGPDGKYSEGDSLLERMGYDEITAVVTANSLVDADLDADEITLDDGEDYTVVQVEINTDVLVGREIEALVNDDEIIYVSAVNGKEVPGTLSGLDANPASGEKISVLALDGAKTKDLKFADDTLVFINRAAADVADLNNDMFGTVVVDGKDIISVIAYDWTEIELLAIEYDEEDEVIRFFDLASEAELDVTDYDAVVVDGAVDALEDIEANDVIYVAEYEFDEDEYAYIYVVRNSAEGEVGRLSTAGDSIKVGGDSYDIATGEATYSDNGNKDLSVYTAKTQLNDFIGEDAIVALNIIGAVRNITIGDLDSTNVLFGVYVANSDGTSYSASAGRKYYIDVYVAAEDDTMTYEVTKKTFDAITFKAADTVVGFTINADGIIDGIKAIANINTLDDSLAIVEGFDVTSLNDKYDYIGDGTDEYFVISKTILADLTELDDPAAYDWADIKGETYTTGTVTADIVYNEDGEALFVAFYDALSPEASDTLFAVVTDKFYAGDGYDTVTLTLPDGTTIDVLLNTSVGGVEDVDDYDVVAYTLSGDDFASVTTMVYGADGTFKTDHADYTNVNAVADRVSGSRLYTRDAGTFVIDSDAVVFVVDLDEEETILGSLSDVRYNRALRIVTDDSNGRAVVIVVVK